MPSLSCLSQRAAPLTSQHDSEPPRLHHITVPQVHASAALIPPEWLAHSLPPESSHVCLFCAAAGARGGGPDPS